MGPLEGLKIIELCGIGPGPVCGMLLADLGADVILVERRRPEPGGIDLTSGAAARFAICHRGKRSIAVDLKQAAGVGIVERLVAGADGLIEGFRPGVTERLGIGPDTCLAINPRLVYGRVTGWGQDGPLARAAGHDLNYVALSGVLSTSGDAGSVPSVPPTVTGDVGGGALYLALGMLAALVSVQNGGEGQVVDAAVTEGTALSGALLYGVFAQGLWSTARQSNFLDGASPWYRCYECRDGRYVSVAALEPAFYRELIDRLGLGDDPEFRDQYDTRRWPVQRERLGELFLTQTRDQWCERLEGTDACFAPVLDLEEAPRHPHNAARGTFTEIDGVTQPAPAPRFSRTPGSAGRGGPVRGADTESVMSECGYSSDEIDAFRTDAVI